MTERNVAWVVCEMDEEMKNQVEAQINKALDKYTLEREVSEHLKKFFDNKYGPNWHCCIGKHFSSFVSY